MSEAVTKTIVGVCEEISEKSGWTKFHINHGGQYTTDLSTKVQAIIDAARAVGTETATWTYKESDGNENPNRPGTFYKNRYLDKVERGMIAEEGTGATEPAPQRPVQGEHAPLPLGDKERSIVRQACLKAAAQLYVSKGADQQGAPTADAPVWQDEAVTLTIMAAARFEMWVMRDLEDIPF